MTDKRSKKAPRREENVPTTWPAFVLAIAIAGGGAIWYALRAPRLSLDAEVKSVAWSIFNHSLVPTVIIALAVWCLLYFGFVRWKNGERGPLHFNTLLGVVFAALILTPFARQQVDLFKAGDVRGLQAQLVKAQTARAAEDAKARIVVDTAIRAAAGDLALDPSTLATASARKAAKTRVAAARQASKDYQVEYADRDARDRAAFLKMVADHKISPDVAKTRVALYDQRAQGRSQRAEYDFDTQQTLFDAVEGGIAALDHGMVGVQGRDVWFSGRDDAVAFNKHSRTAAVQRRRLSQATEAAEL